MEENMAKWNSPENKTNRTKPGAKANDKFPILSATSAPIPSSSQPCNQEQSGRRIARAAIVNSNGIVNFVIRIAFGSN